MFGFRRKPSAPPAAAPTGAEWRSRGNAALALGNLEEAAVCYRDAAAADPADAMARVNLGYVLLEQSRAAEAAPVLLEATRLAGSDRDALADASFLLARAQGAQGLQGDAIASLQAAVAARPGFEEALQELVPALLAAGRAAEALACAEDAARQAASSTRFMLLARALHANDRPHDSLQALDAVLAAQAGHAGALEARGNLLLQLDRPAEALAAFEQAAAGRQGGPETQVNLAAALLKLDRPEEALARADAALLLQPGHRAALHNKVQALLNLLRVEEARDLALQAVALHPDDADLRWNLAVAHLLLGELAPGFEAHEARWQAAGFGSRTIAAIEARPRWDGRESLQNRTILLYAEQGLGDSIQFLRYLPQVAAQAQRVLLQVQQSLLPLLSALPANCEVLAPGVPLPLFDLRCPLLSLPHALGTRLENVPAAIAYLQADPALVRAWSERLPADSRCKVGIAWSGNAAHANDRNRSIALEQFRQLAVDDCCFVSLQPQVRESDRAALAGWPGLQDLGAQLGDFADTAALMTALDLVVTVDTSVAHLAGALGRPVWILLPHCPDWRWMVGRSDSPWYPTARLYRQPAPGQWTPVLAKVREDLLSCSRTC
jgi:tetratricopeptide (TPR) repeat protein